MKRWLLLAGIAVFQPALADEPSYSNFAVPVYHGSIVAPVTKTGQAQTYRTVLKEGAQAGPNFAGHYIFIPIGAGTGTILVAVVDAANGAVYFPKSLPLISWASWWNDPYGPVYQVDSRLLTVYGNAGSEDAASGVSYFEWTRKDFKLLKFTSRSAKVPSS